MEEQKRLFWIQVLAILAIVVSAYLTYEHYEPAESSFCVFGESFNCNVVNKSPYANVDGIFYFLVFDMDMQVPLFNIPVPNAIISMVFFLFLFGAAGSINRNKPFFTMGRKRLLNVMKILLYLSLAYAVYLLYIEAFVLYTYCIFCISLDIILVAVLWLLLGIPLKKTTTKVVKKKKKRR